MFSVIGLLKRGNASSDVKEAVKTVEKRYGISLTVTRKKMFPKGVVCDVTAECSELPDRDIRIFRFDAKTPVQSDYIYRKYSDEAYERICQTVHSVYPDALVVVEDGSYNHFTADRYNGNTTIEDYLLDNQLRINVILMKIYDKEQILKAFHTMAETLLEAGINSYSLAVYCMKNQAAMDTVKTYDHIPDPQAYKGIPAEGVRISVTNHYGRLRDVLNDPESAGLVISHGKPDI